MSETPIKILEKRIKQLEEFIVENDLPLPAPPDHPPGDDDDPPPGG